LADDLTKIHPVNFFKDNVMQSSEIGNPELHPFLQEIQHMNTRPVDNTDIIMKDFIINNVTNLTNTFIIKLLEDYIDKDEIAYLVDFYDSFRLKDYLYNTLSNTILTNTFIDTVANIIESNIIFAINQFIQFYVIYKIVYNKEGVDLYKFLYKATYEKAPENDIKEQDKYVFCCSIMNNMLNELVPDINECCRALRTPLLTVHCPKEVKRNGN
jgi:hypothetical protein